MARMKFKNAWNYDSATRQVDTGDFDFILDTETDVGLAFSLVVDAAITAGLADFTANFINDNDLLSQADADTLYELIGTMVAHLAAGDPHAQYTTAAELTTALNSYLTTAVAAATYSVLGHSHATTFATRTSLTVTTASLAAAAVETGTVAFPDGARLLKLNVSRASRVRLYTTAAARTADAARLIGVDPTADTDHGLLFEYVAGAAIDCYLSPAVDVFQGDGESSIYYAIQNKSLSSGTVAAEFDYLRTE